MRSPHPRLLHRVDVATFGRRPFRLDAEGDDAPLARSNKPLPACRDERGAVACDVIGDQRQHDRRVIAALRKGGAGCNRRARVTPHRLQQHIGLDADLCEPLLHYEAIGRVGDDDRTARHRRRARARPGMSSARRM